MTLEAVPGAAAYQDDADGERFVQREQTRECASQERHHRKLRQAADKNIFGAAEHHAEIFRFERKTHAEHNHTQQGIDERRLQVAQYVGE